MLYRIMWICVLVGVTSLTGVTASAWGGEQAPKNRVILVLDASGSMLAKIQGVPKIKTAKKVVGNIVRKLGSQIDLGLTVYGHRRKDDCADIETLIPPGPVQPSEFMATVNRLNPKGMTPLSQAVIEAAEALHYKEGSSSVILISDGEETCHLDPCKVATDLKANSIDFTIHVIGFDVKEEKARVQLRCLAKNTGGAYLPVDDKRGLEEALETLIGPKSGYLQGYIKAPIEIFSGIGFDVEWEGSNQKGDQIVIVPEGAPDSDLGTHVATAAGSPAKLTGPNTTGPHEIRYFSRRWQQPLGRLKVNVRGAAATVEAPESVIASTDIEVKWTGPNAPGDRIVIVKANEADDGKYILGDFSASTNTPSPIKLRAFSEPGEYEVRYLATQGAKVLARRHITILPSGAGLQVPAEVEAGADFDVQWTGPNSEGNRIVIVEASAQDGSYMINDRLTKSLPTGSPTRLTALSKPGDYEVRYIAMGDGKILARAPIRVLPSTASVNVPTTRILPDSNFEVSWSGPNSEGDSIVIVSSSAQEGTYLPDSKFYQSTQSGNPVKFQAPYEPGSYEVRYMAGIDGATLAKAQVDVAP